MIPITFEQAVDIYAKTKQLGIATLRILVDDYADQMELFGSCLILMGDKLVECEDRLNEANDVNRRLVEALQAFQALSPAELRATADRREAAAPPDSLTWVGSSRVFAERSEEIIDGLVGEIVEFMEAHEAARGESEARHPSNYIDTTATESDENGPNQD